MYTQRVTVKAVALTSLHHPNTLVLTISGRDAFRTTMEELLTGFTRAFGIRDINASYQFDEPLKWYVKLGEASEKRFFEDLHGKSFNLNQEKRVTVEQVGREKSKVVLHWVPPTLPKEGVQEMTSFLSKEKVEAFPHKGRSDRWTIIYTPESGVTVPHYLMLDCGSLKDKKILVLVPGRKQACYTCGSIDHWSSKCNHKRIKNKIQIVEEAENSRSEDVVTTQDDADNVIIPSSSLVAVPLNEVVISPMPNIESAHEKMGEGWKTVEKKRRQRKVLLTREEEESPERNDSSPGRTYAEALTRGTPTPPLSPHAKTRGSNSQKRQLEEDTPTKEGNKVSRCDFFPNGSSEEETGQDIL